MLTDIFADRYEKRPIWDAFTNTEAKLLTQCFRIVSEQLIPYWIDGKESETAKTKWKAVHDRLSMELGLQELAPRYYSLQTNVMGKPTTQTGWWTMDKVCRDFVLATYGDGMDADRFLKERISFVELAFRIREEEIAAANMALPDKLREAGLRESRKSGGLRLPGSWVDSLKANNETVNKQFAQNVAELNERLRRAGTALNYHNGFIQIAADPLIEEEIERPFWVLVAVPLWKNVDLDMKEAIDRRDANDKDPAFYAARALESAIKIISDAKGWTHGGEKGAHNFIDNLASAKNGHFVDSWERDSQGVLY
ncbi:MAG: hypothetical protein MZV65_12430 [Chromatiales bacterium]|nr:hypothetical protein [Chromatiales bacterium]